MLEQQEYQSEGIDITSINFKDNKPILVRLSAVKSIFTRNMKMKCVIMIVCVF